MNASDNDDDDDRKINITERCVSLRAFADTVGVSVFLFYYLCIIIINDVFPKKKKG